MSYYDYNFLILGEFPVLSYFIFSILNGFPNNWVKRRERCEKNFNLGWLKQ